MEVVFQHGPDGVEPHLKLTLTRLGDEDLGELKGCDVEKPIYLLELGDVKPPFREGLAMWLDARGLKAVTVALLAETVMYDDRAFSPDDLESALQHMSDMKRLAYHCGEICQITDRFNPPNVMGWRGDRDWDVFIRRKGSQVQFPESAWEKKD